MEPVYLDFHIHTSSNFENPNQNYDIALLKDGIDKISNGSPSLISITDHNFINKKAYLEAIEVFPNILLGVELHIRNYEECRPYHCHMLLKTEAITEQLIDNVNEKLDKLYPIKTVTNDHKIPKLEDIMNSFDDYEFLLLPHGGQNHSTFDRSIPDGVRFDRTVERSVYYNLFDGFTARGTNGLERTHNYFEKLGIKDFVNLVTSTDNYEPAKYPDCKAEKKAAEFEPTWMLATPSFDGLRLSLSESSRLIYGEKPESWTEFIDSVTLENENIDIDVKLTPGLNVVIGGSSSGKSLFVDSIFHKIANQIEESVYMDTPFGIDELQVINPSGQHPHYFNQNYIMKVCDQKDKKNTIDDISILKSVFPPDEDERKRILNALQKLRTHLATLVESIHELQNLEESLSRIPILSRLIITETIIDNPVRLLLPTDKDLELISYPESMYERHTEVLSEIDQVLRANPLINYDESITNKLQDYLLESLNNSELELMVRSSIEEYKTEIDNSQKQESAKVTVSRDEFQKLLESIRNYLKFHKKFYSSLEEISTFSITIPTKPIVSMGHSLYIENNFELTKEKFLEVINRCLKTKFQLDTFQDIKPNALYKERFRLREPKLTTYQEFENYINETFAEMNKKTYRITTSDGREFEQLSAGWKTSVILDLVLGWDSDTAPLIIDQPEDNLATNYINDGLLKAIKLCKSKKQIILVSHNATIPMLGDAQNIVFCQNDDNKITIKSNPLEGQINGKSVVDLIAEITDGGKPSIKKRVKKYNLKDFRS